MTASTPISDHLLGMAGSTDGDHGDDAGVAESGHLFAAWSRGETRDPDPPGNEQVDAFDGIRLTRQEVHPEGFVGPIGDLRDRLVEFLQAHRGRSQDAQPPGDGSGGGEACPRDPTHPGLHDRITHSEEFGCGGVQGAMALEARFLAHDPVTSRNRRPWGSRCSNSSDSSG